MGPKVSTACVFDLLADHLFIKPLLVYQSCDHYRQVSLPDLCLRRILYWMDLCMLCIVVMSVGFKLDVVRGQFEVG